MNTIEINMVELCDHYFWTIIAKNHLSLNFLYL